MLHSLLQKSLFAPMRTAYRFQQERYERAGVSLRWTGVASCIFEYEGQRLAIDPFASRPTLSRAFTGRKLTTDTDAVDRWIPTLDYVAVGHSHYDHVMDVPYLATRDGARVAGSRSTRTILAKQGVPAEQIVTMPKEGGRVELGPFTVTFVPSRHCELLFGRVPYPGEVASDFSAPAPASAYRTGDVFGLVVEVAGVKFYHNGSANLDDDALADVDADVALISLAGARNTPRYYERLLGRLEPDTVIPLHWDAFFAPLEEGMRVLPNVDFEDFFARTKSMAPHPALIIPAWDPDAPLASTDAFESALESAAS